MLGDGLTFNKYYTIVSEYNDFYCIINDYDIIEVYTKDFFEMIK